MDQNGGVMQVRTECAPIYFQEVITMKHEGNLPIPQITVIIGTLVSLSILYFSNSESGIDMEIGSVIAISVAIIGAASGIWMQVIQFKKDSRKLGEVKEDTGVMKPQVDNINENMKEVKNDIIRTVLPEMKKVSETGAASESGIQKLVEELNFQNRVKNEISTALHNRDYFLSGIDKLYEENGKLSVRVRDLEKETQVQQYQIVKLKEENEKLSQRIKELQPTKYRNHDMDFER